MSLIDTNLPPALTDEAICSLLKSIDLPRPKSIQPLQVTAAFHAIYLLHYAASTIEALHPAKALNEDGSISLVLRVSGNHIPQTKTRNEVAVMTWVRERNNGKIPVPAVVRFDASSNNPIGYEFTILERARGKSVDKIYASLGDAEKIRLVRQLIDVLLEMNRHEWHHIGGLQLNANGEVVPGPVLEDTYWTVPDIERFWPAGETVSSLNPTGPYASHTELIRGYLECFIHAIKTHDSLSWLSESLPRLSALISKLPTLSTDLDSSKLVIAHKDLHFANIMATPDGELTAILDWEFATVVPAHRWDPVRAFLWNGVYSEEANLEKEKMRQIFEELLRERGEKQWWDIDEGNKQSVTDAVWTVIRFVRALVEVCPKGQRADKVEGWKRMTEEALVKLGV